MKDTMFCGKLIVDVAGTSRQAFDNMFRVELFRKPIPMIKEDESVGEASEKKVGEDSEKVRRCLGSMSCQTHRKKL